MTRPTIIAGNWKLNPPREDGEQLYREIVSRVGTVLSKAGGSSFEVLVCPPFPYLGVLEPQARVQLGGQDLSRDSWGAHTGEISGELLRSFGASHVLVGHSERRHDYGESDVVCAGKLAAATAAGLTPVLCVGETEPERDAGETFEVVARQLQAIGSPEGGSSSPDGAPSNVGSIVIAYEPVWAIGTGRTATPEQVAEVHRFIRNRLVEGAVSRQFAADPNEWAARVPILYGGSVKPDNAAALLKDLDVDGALVGGASLGADSFLAILEAAIAAKKPSGAAKQTGR